MPATAELKPRLSLNPETVRSLASPTGDELVQALCRKSYQKTLLGLSLVRQRLMADAPALCQQTGFESAFDLLRRSPAAVQEQILTYPTAAFWVDVAEDLLRRESHLRYPEMHCTTHLESFLRFALAAHSLNSSESLDGLVRTDAAARICLPGTATYLQLPPKYSYHRFQIRLSGANLQFVPEGDQHALPIQVHAALRLVPKIDWVELNSVDGDLRLPGRTRFDYDEIDAGGAVKWESPIRQSLEWIASCSPLLFREMQAGLRSVVPVRSAGPDIHASATFREAPGLMALSWTPDAAVMVEAMVHEYHHNKLNTLLVLDPLLIGSTEEAVFYSPWRPDPRPLLGVLHGAFVFQAVLEFWDRFFSAGIPLLQEERVRQRMYLIQGQTREAVEILEKEGVFSKLGNALLQAIKENTERFETSLSPAQRVIQDRIDEARREHRAKWAVSNAGARTLQTHLSTAPEDEHPILAEALRIINHSGPLQISSLTHFLPVTDQLLERLMTVNREQGLGALLELIPKEAEDFPPGLNLLAGHVCYATQDYARAAFFYARLTQQVPTSPYFWQCFAFAARHLGQLEDSAQIITNLGRIASSSEDCDDTQPPVLERLAAAKKILARCAR